MARAGMAAEAPSAAYTEMVQADEAKQNREPVAAQVGEDAGRYLSEEDGEIERRAHQYRLERIESRPRGWMALVPSSCPNKSDPDEPLLCPALPCRVPLARGAGIEPGAATSGEGPPGCPVGPGPVSSR